MSTDDMRTPTPPPTLSRDQSRRLDQRAQDDFSLPGLVLMENAGRAVADTLVRIGATSPVLICCGKGNNAGDGFVIARHLDLRGIEVRVLLFASPTDLQGDALANFDVIRRSGLPIDIFIWGDGDGPLTVEAALTDHLQGASWIVDALLGTGAKGSARPPLNTVIDYLNHQQAQILSVDVPSGFDCDTGETGRSTIRAQHTCTFVAYKPGFLAEGAVDYTGRVEVLDIGAPRCLVEELLAENDVA